MSGSIGLATTPLTDAEKADLRRFMGYGAYGAGASGFNGWRFFQAYGQIEYKFNNMSPAELQIARQYLAQLYPLEAAIASIANINVASAGPFTRNKNEQRDRDNLFNSWRRRLCGFFGSPTGPNLGSGGIRIIV